MMEQDKTDFLNLGFGNEGFPFSNLTEKQWKILEAALQAFTEKGYSASTTSEIAKRAGVAEGTIFRHFKTKKDILFALLIPLLQNLVGPNAAYSLNKILLDNQDRPLKELLVLILEDRQQMVIKNQALFRFVITEAQYHPELREILINQVVAKNQSFLIDFIEQRQNKGELRKDLDKWVLTRSGLGMLLLYIVSQHVFTFREPGGDNRERLEEIVELFLHGAMNDSGVDK